MTDALKKERDEALDQATQTRNQLSKYIQEKTVQDSLFQKKYKDMCDEQEEKISKLKQSIKENKNEIDNLIDEKDEIIKDHQTQIDKLNKEKNNIIKDNKTQMDALKDDHNNVVKDLKDQIDKLKDEKNEIKDKVEGFQNTIGIKDAEIEHLNKEKAELNKQIHDLNQEYKNQDTTLAEVKKERNDLKAELDKLKDIISKLKEKHENLNDNQNELFNSNEFLKNKHSKLQDEHELLEFNQNQIKDQYLALENDLNEANKKIKKVSSELIEYPLRVENARNAEAKTREANKFLRYEIEKKNSEIDAAILEQDSLRKDKIKIVQDMEQVKQQLEDAKNMQNTLILSLTQNISDNQRGEDIILTNQRLSTALSKIEDRANHLEIRIKELKQFEDTVNASVAIQCAQCSKLIYTQDFNTHLINCYSTTNNIDREFKYKIQEDQRFYQFKVIESKKFNNQEDIFFLIDIDEGNGTQLGQKVIRSKKDLLTVQNNLNSLDLPCNKQFMKYFHQLQSPDFDFNPDKYLIVQQQLNDIGGISILANSKEFVEFIKNTGQSEWDEQEDNQYENQNDFCKKSSTKASTRKLSLLHENSNVINKMQKRPSQVSILKRAETFIK